MSKRLTDLERFDRFVNNLFDEEWSKENKLDYKHLKRKLIKLKGYETREKDLKEGRW